MDRLTDEQIEEYRKLQLEERLRWLEEAQEFMFKALSKRNGKFYRNLEEEKFK